MKVERSRRRDTIDEGIEDELAIPINQVVDVAKDSTSIGLGGSILQISKGHTT
jgi:hypothetical protein